MRTDYLDATTGDTQLNLDWRASLSARLRHEQSSMNPVMADANSIAESQQKPSNRPKHHPPREPVLQVIRDLFQPFTLSRGAGLDAPPFRRRTFHQSLYPLCDCFRVSKLHLDLFRRLPGCLNVNFGGFFQLLVLAVHRAGKTICHRLTLPPVFSQMQFNQFTGIIHQSRQIGRDAPLRLGEQCQLHWKIVVRSDAPFVQQSVNPIHFVRRHPGAKHRQVILVQIHNLIRPN